MAVYACSDLHGMYNLYEKICNFIEPEDTVYFLGDANDRGPDSWKLIKAIAANPQFIYLKGNHEDMLMKAMIEEYSFDDDINWGNAYALLAYNDGVDTFNDWLDDGAPRGWINYLRDLPTYATYENVCGQTVHLSHAGFTYQEDGTIPYSKDLMWNRKHITAPRTLTGQVSNAKNIVVHGHTPIPYIFESNNYIGMCVYEEGTKICIDAGSFDTGRTILLDLDTFSEYSLSIED